MVFHQICPELDEEIRMGALWRKLQPGPVTTGVYRDRFLVCYCPVFFASKIFLCCFGLVCLCQLPGPIYFPRPLLLEHQFGLDGGRSSANRAETALQQILDSAWFYILCKAPPYFLTAVNNLLALDSVFYIKPFFVNSAIWEQKWCHYSYLWTLVTDHHQSIWFFFAGDRIYLLLFVCSGDESLHSLIVVTRKKRSTFITGGPLLFTG